MFQMTEILTASYNNVGITYGDLGDHAKALEFQLMALEICKKVLPPDHPDIAISCNNIAGSYARQGQYAEALKWERRAMEIAEHSLPEDHPYRRACRKGVEYLERKLASSEET